SVMDLTRLAVDAGQFINRAVQYTGESLGQADKTGLDPGLEGLLAQADATKTWTDSIISQTEVLLQPSLARLEDRLYEHLEWSAPPRPRAHELLGDQMTQAGLEVGSNTPYGTALIRFGEAQKQLGEAERKFAECTNIHFLTPLKSFTEGEYRAIQNERKMLVNKRLDLDVAKTSVWDTRSKNMAIFLSCTMPSNGSCLCAKAEMELRICQSLFDRQSEITRRALEGISSTHIDHMRSLADFVDGQASFFAQGNQHAQELQRQMSRFAFIINDLNDNYFILITTMKTRVIVEACSTSYSGAVLCKSFGPPQFFYFGTNSLPSAARDSTRTSNATFTNGAATAVALPPQRSAIRNETQTGDAEATDITASTDVVPDSQTTNETHERPVTNGEDV
uniref:Endophilin-B1-like n=1 Tax=Poecilia reticulata TaxID=8081 RepID=A0A3P9P5L0_POERE